MNKGSDSLRWGEVGRGCALAAELRVMAESGSCALGDAWKASCRMGSSEKLPEFRSWVFAK